MMTVLEKQYMESVILLNRQLQSGEIDWEQRRYEISREVLASSSLPMAVDLLSSDFHLGNDSLPVACARQAVEMADALIKELKKEKV